MGMLYERCTLCKGTGVVTRASGDTVCCPGCKPLRVTETGVTLAQLDRLVKDAERVYELNSEVACWRSHAAAQSRGHHDRVTGHVPEDGCPYPAPATPEDETSERAHWYIGWSNADAHIRYAELETEVVCLRAEMAEIDAQLERAIDHEARLTQRCCELEAEVIRLQRQVEAHAARIAAQSDLLTRRAEGGRP